MQAYLTINLVATNRPPAFCCGAFWDLTVDEGSAAGTLLNGGAALSASDPNSGVQAPLSLTTLIYTLTCSHFVPRRCSDLFDHASQRSSGLGPPLPRCAFRAPGPVIDASRRRHSVLQSIVGLGTARTVLLQPFSLRLGFIVDAFAVCERHCSRDHHSYRSSFDADIVRIS